MAAFIMAGLSPGNGSWVTFTPPPKKKKNRLKIQSRGFVPVPGLCFGQPYTFMSHLNLSLTTEVPANMTPPSLRCDSSHSCCRTCHTYRCSLLSCPPMVTVTRHVIKPFSVWRRVILLSHLDIIAGNELVVGARTAEWSALFKYAQGFLVAQQH